VALSLPPLIQFMEHRVADPRILCLIRKWLKAGVVEEGRWSEPETVGVEPVDADKPSLDDRAIGSSQFEVIARFQACLVSHCKRHHWSEVKRSVLKLEYVGNNDE
jgi:hypothetical protein